MISTGTRPGAGDQVRARCAGQAQVADDQVVVLQLKVAFRIGDGARLVELVAVAFEQAAQRHADDGLVLDDQYSVHECKDPSLRADT
jgi:hypothetical protein